MIRAVTIGLLNLSIIVATCAAIGFIIQCWRLLSVPAGLGN